MTAPLQDPAVLAFVGATPAEVTDRVKRELDLFWQHVQTRQGDWQQVQPGREWSPAQEVEHVMLISGAVTGVTRLLLSDRPLRAVPQEPGVLRDGKRQAPASALPSEQGVATFKELCPSCGFAETEFTTANLDKLASSVSAALVGNPETNTVIVPVDSFVPPVLQGIQASNFADKVKVVRDDSGLAVGFATEGDFPRYGNDDDRADDIGVWLLRTFLEMIKKRHTYRNSEATTSILTITSNVVYGKYTGALPDGRKAYTPFAPGANPSYGAEQNGLLASLNSVAKLPYHWALDGISNTQTINPDALGHSEGERVENLVQVMDGYFDQGAHHLNVNVFGKEKLIDAMGHPEKEEYANFTIRVSGYAVKFIDLTREQQLDVISRTCHGRL